MKKLLITTAVLLTALPFSFDGVTPTISKAHAILGRPLTPFSVAGVHRRAVRRTYGIGANLGYRGSIIATSAPMLTARRLTEPVGAAVGEVGVGIAPSTAAQRSVGAAVGEVGAGIGPGVLSTAAQRSVGGPAGEVGAAVGAGIGPGAGGDRQASRTQAANQSSSHFK